MHLTWLYTWFLAVDNRTWLVKYFRNPIAEPQFHKLLPAFERLCIVSYNDLGYLKCFCCYYERMGLPCAHILQLTDIVDIAMCDICWWNNFCYHYGRKAEITKAFDNAIQSKLPGVPWKYIHKNDEVMFPILSEGTTEEHYKDMKFLFDNFGHAFLKGRPRLVPKERKIMKIMMKV